MLTPRKMTMLDVVQAVSAYAKDDEEIVATVASLINSGKILLCGSFAGAKIDLTVSAYATARSRPSPLPPLKGHLPYTRSALDSYSFATQMGQKDVGEKSVATAPAVTQPLSKIPVTRRAPTATRRTRCL